MPATIISIVILVLIFGFITDKSESVVKSDNGGCKSVLVTVLYMVVAFGIAVLGGISILYFMQ